MGCKSSREKQGHAVQSWALREEGERMRMGAGGKGPGLLRAECAGKLETENSYATRASAAGAVQARAGQTPWRLGVSAHDGREGHRRPHTAWQATRPRLEAAPEGG